VKVDAFELMTVQGEGITADLIIWRITRVQIKHINAGLDACGRRPSSGPVSRSSPTRTTRCRWLRPDDNSSRLWDAGLQRMSVKDLLAEACARLAGATKLTREEMRLAGYPDIVPGIDGCKE
jgi:hypothetical protein